MLPATAPASAVNEETIPAMPPAAAPALKPQQHQPREPTSRNLFGAAPTTNQRLKSPSPSLSVVPSGFTSAPLSRQEKVAALKAVDENQIRNCNLCRLCERR